MGRFNDDVCRPRPDSCSTNFDRNSVTAYRYGVRPLYSVSHAVCATTLRALGGHQETKTGVKIRGRRWSHAPSTADTIARKRCTQFLRAAPSSRSLQTELREMPSSRAIVAGPTEIFSAIW